MNLGPFQHVLYTLWWSFYVLSCVFCIATWANNLLDFCFQLCFSSACLLEISGTSAYTSIIQWSDFLHIYKLLIWCQNTCSAMFGSTRAHNLLLQVLTTGLLYSTVIGGSPLSVEAWYWYAKYCPNIFSGFISVPLNGYTLSVLLIEILGSAWQN